MVHEGCYMVQEAKLWYDYIIMVRSGNAGSKCKFEFPKNMNIGIFSNFPAVIEHNEWLS